MQREQVYRGLHPALYHLYMSDFLKRWKESGLKVRVWTVNREEDMKHFIEAGLEAVDYQLSGYSKLRYAGRWNMLKNKKLFLLDIDGYGLYRTETDQRDKRVSRGCQGQWEASLCSSQTILPEALKIISILFRRWES